MMKRILIACLFAFAAIFAVTPASAVTVTDTFTGHVIYADSSGFDPTTTDDFNNNFGGGSLIGKAFTLTMTTTVDPGTAFAVGGTYYFGTSPIVSTLSINGYSFTISDSSDGFAFDLGNGTIEKYLQTFVWSFAFGGIQQYGIAVDLTTNVPATADLGTALPPMLLSNGDFYTTYAAFYDQSTLFSTGVETINLGIEEVNIAAQVPEPATMLLLGLGLMGWAAARKIRR